MRGEEYKTFLIKFVIKYMKNYREDMTFARI